MDLSKKEISYVGIPKEFYDPKFKSKFSDEDLEKFSYDQKIYKAKTTTEFFNLCGKCFNVLKSKDLSVTGCKTFTCQDFSLFSNHKDLFEALSKVQVLGLLDIDQAVNKRFVESFLRKWFEAKKSVIVLYTKNFKSLTGYSDWFIEMLSLKEIK